MFSRLASKTVLAGAGVAGVAGAIGTWAYADTLIEITEGATTVKITMGGAGAAEPACAPCAKKDSCCSGPGYATPMDAYLNGKKEKLLYVPCIQPDPNSGKPDYLATVDCDPDSPTYSQVIHRLPCGIGDELHHSGWNACSSCHGDTSKSRKYLILPSLKSGNINIVDCATDARAPKLHKVVTGEEIANKTGYTSPHTSHCLGSGEIMISMMGDLDKEAACGFILLDENFDLKGMWEKEKGASNFGYDFWYQPFHNIMISSAWGAPKYFEGGFNPAHVAQGGYGSKLYFWDWAKRTIFQTTDIGVGTLPLELRFKHDPKSVDAFVGAALESSVYHIYKPDLAKNEWKTQKIIQVEPKGVEGWALPNMPGLITDILISMDDKYLYFSNWLHGDIRQYDISDPQNPKMTGQIFLGGSVRNGGPVRITNGEAGPVIPTVQGTELQGGPQMIQLSLDGKRLYVTNSLFAAWDRQFYPGMAEKGSQLLQIDVDTENGGLSVNENFLVDFGAEPDGPVFAHEVRYPGGDCSSDIYLAPEEAAPPADF